MIKVVLDWVAPQYSRMFESAYLCASPRQFTSALYSQGLSSLSMRYCLLSVQLCWAYASEGQWWPVAHDRGTLPSKISLFLWWPTQHFPGRHIPADRSRAEAMRKFMGFSHLSQLQWLLFYLHLPLERRHWTSFWGLIHGGARCMLWKC